MQLFVLAATLAVAFAAPQITSNNDDITITGKTIKFSEMVGSSDAVNRAFTITKDDIQFSSDSSDTYTNLVTMVLNEQNRQAQLLTTLNNMKTAYDGLVTKYNDAKAKQANIDSTIGAAITKAQQNLQKLKDANTNDLQPALAKVKTDVTSTSSLDTSKASAINTAMDSLSANGLFDTVEARIQTAFDTAKSTGMSVSSAAATTTATIDPRVMVITDNVTRMSVNFSTYGPAAVESVQTSTKAALDLAAGYVAFVNGELAYADVTLPALTAANTGFARRNATISALIKANGPTYKKQLDIFRPVIKSIYGGAITQKIAPSSTLAYDYFGQVLAADGNTLVSGMQGYGRSGGVAVVKFDGVSFSKDWDQIIPYPLTTTDLYSSFGTDVAIEGNTLVVGAPYADRLTPLPRLYSTGRAYIYTRTDENSNFTMLQALAQPTVKANDRFGFAVAINNGVVYVSAPGHENGTVLDHGSIFTFTKNTKGTYTLAATLFDSQASTGAYDQLGSTNTGLAAAGDYVAAGAQFAEGTTTGSSHGEVMIFKKGTSSWTQTQKIIGTQVAAGDNFGSSVHMTQLKDGTLLMAVGTVGDDGNATTTVFSSGAVYLFEKKPTATNFTETQVLRAADAMSYDYFGREVAFSPDGMTLMVTADGVDDVSTLPIRYSLGAVYKYARNANGKFVQTVRELPTEASGNYQYFGRGLASTNSFSAVGAYGDSTNVAYGGAVYASYSGGEI